MWFPRFRQTGRLSPRNRISVHRFSSQRLPRLIGSEEHQSFDLILTFRLATRWGPREKTTRRPPFSVTNLIILPRFTRCDPPIVSTKFLAQLSLRILYRCQLVPVDGSPTNRNYFLLIRRSGPRRSGSWRDQRISILRIATVAAAPSSRVD